MAAELGARALAVGARHQYGGGVGGAGKAVTERSLRVHGTVYLNLTISQNNILRISDSQNPCARGEVFCNDKHERAPICVI